MRPTILKFHSLICLSAILTFGVWFSSPGKVSAQCSTPSSCKTCHEVQAQKPVNFDGDWHIQHSFVDFCAECHGGNRLSLDKNTAHLKMAATLVQMSSNCAGCHENDLEEKFRLYASQLGINDPAVINQALQTAFSAANARPAFLPLDPLSIPLPGSTKSREIPETSTMVLPPNPADSVNIALALVFFTLIGGGGSYVAWNEQRRRARHVQQPGYVTWVISQIQNPTWSPYVAGVLLGFVAILAVVSAHHLLSASGGIAAIASTTLNAAVPDFAENNIYFHYRIPPGLLTWEVLLLAGMFLGGLSSALLSGTFRLRWNDDKKWNRVFGPQKWKRFVIGFLGGIIIQYGASIAGGCTSGLAISGGMLLAPSAFIFMAGMFASGILVALLVYRKKY